MSMMRFYEAEGIIAPGIQNRTNDCLKIQVKNGLWGPLRPRRLSSVAQWGS
jgi:hypothetical protein